MDALGNTLTKRDFALFVASSSASFFAHILQIIRNMQVNIVAIR